jgi:hypothetical protein
VEEQAAAHISILDVREDPAITSGLAELRASGIQLSRSQSPVLADVIPIVGTPTILENATIIDMYGHILVEEFTGAVLPVAYVPVDQGGNPMPQGSDIYLREQVTVVRGEQPTTSGIADQNKDGIFIDVHTVPGIKPTILNQKIIVDQIPGGCCYLVNKSISEVIIGANRPNVVVKNFGTVSVGIAIGDKEKLP